MRTNLFEHHSNEI